MAVTTTSRARARSRSPRIHVPDNVRALDDAHVKALLGVFRCSPTARGSGDRDGNLVADNRVHDNDEGIAVCCSDSNVVEDMLSSTTRSTGSRCSSAATATT